MVKLVNQDNHGFIQLIGITELVYGAHFHAVGRVHNHQRHIRYVEGRNNVPHKVVGAGAIDEIHHLIFPFVRQQSGENGVAVFFFHRKIVTHGVFSFHRSASFYKTTLEEHRFCESGLT